VISSQKNFYGDSDWRPYQVLYNDLYGIILIAAIHIGLDHNEKNRNYLFSIIDRSLVCMFSPPFLWWLISTYININQISWQCQCTVIDPLFFSIENDLSVVNAALTTDKLFSIENFLTIIDFVQMMDIVFLLKQVKHPYCSKSKNKLLIWKNQMASQMEKKKKGPYKGNLGK
jgi:hypothetical protein